MPQSNFEIIATSVIQEHEGGFNDIKEDRGGATNYGISLRFLKSINLLDGDITDDGHVTKDDIKAVTLDEALRLYKSYFWDHYNVDQFVTPVLQRKMFSLLINMRGKTAMKCCQRALRCLGYQIADDGIFGSKSRDAFEDAVFKFGPSPLLASIKSEAAGIYRLIANSNPDQEKFIKGWLNRAYD